MGPVSILIVCLFVPLSFSSPQVTRMDENLTFSRFDWETKKAYLDLKAEVETALADFDSRAILTLGDPCDYELGVKRVNFASKIVPDAIGIFTPDADVKYHLNSMNKTLQGFGELREGKFCNGRHFVDCREKGVCDCARLSYTNRDLVGDGEYCRIQPGSPCDHVDVFVTGRFKDQNVLTHESEAQKCAYGYTCIIKETGQKCSKRNIRRQFKSILKNSTGLTKEEQEKLQVEWNKNVWKIHDYCICGANNLYSSILLILIGLTFGLIKCV